MIAKEEIRLEVVYDEIDNVIMDALSILPCSVFQLRSILQFKLRVAVPYMQIVRKLEYLHILGKVGKKKKNARVYEYYLLT